MKKVNYTKELLEEKVKDCYSFAELCRRLGLKPEGSNPKTVRKKMDEFGVDSSAASNMVNNFNFIKELYCWAFSSYDEKNDIYKINIRSRGPVINTVAQKYNGGGHKLASGGTLKSWIDLEEFVKLADELLKSSSVISTNSFHFSKSFK